MRRFPKNILKKYPEELGILKKLNSPKKIQDFLETLPANFEPEGDTSRSPLAALKERKAHCIEGALIAAAALWYHGKPPLLMDLKTTRDDDDHVVALFKENGRWGAISKTNHAVLRYRDPIYKNIRELAMSYFHEYFLDTGVKTLRSYSAPFDVSKYGGAWLIASEDLWQINNTLDGSKHFSILPKGAATGANAARRLRRADPVERKAGKIVRWPHRTER